MNKAWTPAREYFGDRPCLPLAAWTRISQWSPWEQKRRGSRYVFWFNQSRFLEREEAPYWSFLQSPKFRSTFPPLKANA